MVINGLPSGEALRQQAPLQAGYDHKTQGIKDAFAINTRRTPYLFSRQQWLDKLPLCLGEVG
jgi:hypothetical protein